jgi:hypothetical protein
MQKIAGKNQRAVSCASGRRINAAEKEIDATVESTTSTGVHLQYSRGRLLFINPRKMAELIQNRNFSPPKIAADIARIAKAETATAAPPGSKIVGNS